MSECKILIGGDVCPTSQNYELFKEGDINVLFDKLLVDLKDSDLNLINLECPLIVKESPIYKIGPTLGANIKCINALKKANINMVNLGNNHIMDHGIQGIKTTLNILKKKDINYVGVGEYRNTAKQMEIKKVKDFNIGIISITESGFYNFKEGCIGTFPIDIIDINKELIKNREKCDFIIALVHSGVEHYPYPSPKGQKFSRFLIEQGVDCVIWQHSHCSGYIEKYRKKYIIYGQGNMIFAWEKMHADWYKGYIVKLILKKYKNKKIISKLDIIPFVQSFNKPGIYVLENEQKQKFIDEIFSKEEKLKNENFVEDVWNKFCNKQKEWYLTELIGYDRILKKDKALKEDNKLNVKLFKRFGVDNETLLKLQNLLESETHNEMIKTSLELYIKDKKGEKLN